MRLDQFLVSQKKCRSRTQAKEWIESGKVFINKQKITKPSYLVSEVDEIKIADFESLNWVSRSGMKLNGALNKLSLNLNGKSCFDVGQSTGGFTQAMLRAGAKQVVGLDVGTDQLDDSLKNRDDVVSLESFDARNLGELKGKWDVDFVAVDVSFISVLKVLNGVLNYFGPLEERKCKTGLLLIKPQFEVGKEFVKKGGLVTDPSLHLRCEKEILAALSDYKIEVKDYFPSSVKGRDGNQEFICYISF